ncbi:MAG: HK97 gp10 family phage protein [Acinetobacter sp.]
MAWQGKKPTEFSIDVRKQTEQKIKQMALETVQSLMMGSPVMDGAYRASHVVSINQPDYSTRAGSSKAPKGSIDAKSQAEALEKLVLFKLGNTVFIQNNLAYARRLEYGWSGQAPEGVYAVTFHYISQKYGK